MFIIILLFLILVYIIYNNIFTNIKFLNKKQGCKILSRQKNYFNKFNKNDFIARKCNNIDKCIKKYCNNVLEFNYQDKMVITKYINKISKNNYLKNSIWKFIKVSDEIENGYPHTHEDYIIIPQRFMNEILENNGSRVLIHEQIHIMQRYHKKKMRMDLVNNLKFNMVKNIEGIDKYKNRIRANPDEDNNYWIYDNKILPLCLYNSEPTNIGDADYYGLYIKNNKVVSDLIKLYNIKEYQYNNLGKNNYNGFEVQAEIWENKIKN